MEIQGMIIAALEPRSGVAKSTGKPFKVAQYIIETQEQYPRKVVIDVFGEERINQFNIQTGELLTVYFDVDAREYNGNWYNTIRAYNVTRVSEQATIKTDELPDFLLEEPGEPGISPF